MLFKRAGYTTHGHVIGSWVLYFILILLSFTFVPSFLFSLNDGLKKYLPLSGGKITASIFGSSGGQFAVDGNVYIKGNGYDGWLTDYLNLRPKVVFEGIVHENTNAILETNSMYLFFSMTDISGEQYNPYVAFIYTGKTHINRLDIVGGTGGWASLPTNGGTIQGLYPVNGAYNHVVIVKLYPL